MQGQQAAEQLNKLAVQLSEHFDAVQLLATKLEPNGSTSSYSIGSGNWFARRELAARWLRSDEYNDFATVLVAKLKEISGGG